MRAGYTGYNISAEWLAKRSSNNLSNPLAGTLEPGTYKNCILINKQNNKLTVRDLDSNRQIESSVFTIPSNINVGDAVQIKVALYGDYIIVVKGDGSFYAVDPVAKYSLNKIAGPSIKWVRDWAAEKGLIEQRPMIIQIFKSRNVNE